MKAIRRLHDHLFFAGVAEAFAVIALLTAVLVFFTQSLGYPSPELCYSIAGVGIAILLGYVVESVWMVSRAKRRTWHENWLGLVCGFGLGGLLGIATALVVAAHREGRHGNLLDDLGIWWSISSLAMLGILVTLHPFIADRWSRAA